MMSLQVLERVNKEAEMKHSESIPLVLVTPDDVGESLRIPFLGSRVPEGWRRIDASWFVDVTGIGKAYGQARTQGQFLRSLRYYVAENPGLGYAVYERGEFQAHVGVYAKC